MNVSSKQAICSTVFGVIDGVQAQQHPDDRIAGIAATLLLACDTGRFDLSETLNVARRVLKDAEVYAPANLRAAQDYVRNEL